MIACAIVFSFLGGIAVSQLLLDERVRREKEKRLRLISEMQSGLEHEARMRSEIAKLKGDNMYLRARNFRSKL